MTESSMATTSETATSTRSPKSNNAFRTISEVADELQVAQHVLRFWESKFPQVRPLKRGGGRRYYRPEDIEVLKQIRTLLYDEGYTIKGAQRHLRGRRGKDGETTEQPTRRASSAAATRVATVEAQGPLPHDSDWRVRLSELRDDLKDIMAALEKARAGQH